MKKVGLGLARCGLGLVHYGLQSSKSDVALCSVVKYLNTHLLK